MKRKSQPAPAERVDKTVKAAFPTLTGRQIEEALEGQLILDAKGRRVKKGDRLSADGSLDYSKLESHLARLREGNPEIKASVVHEAPGFCVIDKPAGLPSHPLSLFDEATVTHWAFARFPATRTEFPEIQPTLAPHRLDTGTSGLLIVALNPEAYASWRESFRRKEVRKEYLAWCWGKPAWDSRAVTLPIAHDPKDRRRMIAVKEGSAYAAPLLPATSRIEIVKRDLVRGAFLARVVCETGVTHQVRVHLACLGHPLVGDILYDSCTRSVLPPHHQLRAVRLESSRLSLSLEESSFAAGLPSI